MDDLKWVSIIIGALGALLGVYLRESYRRALNQRRIAVQLDAYLNYWQMDLLRSDFGSLVILVENWDKERMEALKAGGEKAFVEVYQKQGELIKDIKRAVKSGDKTFVSALEGNYSTLKKMSDNVFDLFLSEMTYARGALLSGKSFITDQDAAELSWVAAQRVVTLKGNLTSLMLQVKLFALTLRHAEHLDAMSVSDSVGNIIERLVEISYDLHALKATAKKYATTPLIKLVLDNMRLKA